jgi:microcystin-dependent protein
MTSYRREIFTLSAHQKPTVGDTKTSAQNSDHIGWLKCDGRSLSKTDFYFLWAVIGYSFGGSGDSFNLPDAEGKVPGLQGANTDSSSNVDNFIFGSTIGEYQHILTINEMPSHNHGVAAGLQSSFNNSTSLEYTRISVNVSTTMITDSGHTHTYVQTNNSNNTNADALPATSSPNNEGIVAGNPQTGTGNAVIVDPGHKHDITDPGHRHTLNSAGGDQKHNNIQPTIVIGNLFIYSGKAGFNTTSPAFYFPYTAGKNIL